MNLNKTLGRIALVAVVAANAGTVALAVNSCWYTPKAEYSSRNHCNLAGDYISFNPAAPTSCAWVANGFDGCKDGQTEEYRRDVFYSAANCTGDVTSDTGWVDQNTTDDWATAFTCFD